MDEMTAYLTQMHQQDLARQIIVLHDEKRRHEATQVITELLGELGLDGSVNASGTVE